METAERVRSYAGPTKLERLPQFPSDVRTQLDELLRVASATDIIACGYAVTLALVRIRMPEGTWSLVIKQRRLQKKVDCVLCGRQSRLSSLATRSLLIRYSAFSRKFLSYQCP